MKLLQTTAKTTMKTITTPTKCLLKKGRNNKQAQEAIIQDESDFR